ncbi:MAG: glutamate racemase [Cyclobacteriaceae bacterium]|nr:MAG: glutamate racemase [Cyclobacteriaceae bacterium]
MSVISSAPIGIFDSGIGGLTVARAVKAELPGEQVVYFGDTAHLPYGDKSTAAIQAYSIKITQMLLEKGCKLILIACNSASAAGYDLVTEYVGTRAKVLNVIDPVVDYLREHFAHKRVGLIGTKQTVNSKVYEQKIAALNQGIVLKSLATPLLVPIIEEGFTKGEISSKIIHKYLNDPELADLEALILGCTHYPLIKEAISNYYTENVEVIDSSEIVAKALKAYLSFNNLHNRGETKPDHFLVSDFTDSFEASTRMFFGRSIHLELVQLVS